MVVVVVVVGWVDGDRIGLGLGYSWVLLFGDAEWGIGVEKRWWCGLLRGICWIVSGIGRGFVGWCL